MVPLPLEPGDPPRLGGYELSGRLGAGGQGVVYLGRRPDGPQVAVKLLHARLLADAQARARFVRELTVLRRVAGFCTAQVLEADMAGDQPYIVSEYVPGPSLRELVAGRGPRAGADLERLAIGSVTALAAIHRAGIVHRDFKPHNVLLGPDGPRVIDFGIARALDTGATLTSQLMGTPAYMAPEQFAGGVVGPAADLYSWGVTMVYAATGRDPHGGGPLAAVMYRILHETPDVSGLPPQLADTVRACLAKDPAARPNAEQVLLRLLGEGSATGPTSFPPADPSAPVPSGPPATREDTPSPAPGLARTTHPTRTARPSTAPYPQGDPLAAQPSPHGTQATSRPSDQDRYGPSVLGEREAPRPADQGQYRSSPSGGREAPADAAGWEGGQDRYRAPAAGEHGGSPTGWQVSRPAGQGLYGAPGRDETAGFDRAAGVPEAGTAGAPGGVAERSRPALVRRTPALVAGLLLAVLLAGLDVAALAIFVADPTLAEGRPVFLVAAGVFTLIAMVTVVAAAVAWRGGRAAVRTVIGLRVAREALWAVWATAELQAELAGSRQLQAYLFHVAVTVAVVALLIRALRRGSRR